MASMRCICSAISGLTRCRSLDWARGSRGSTSHRARSRLPASWPASAVSTPVSSSRSCTPCPPCSGRSSTSCTPGWARSTGCPTSPAGRGSWPVCCGPAGACIVRDGAPDAPRDGLRRRRRRRCCRVVEAYFEAETQLLSEHEHTYTDGPTGDVARAVPVEPRARRDRAGSDRRGTHRDRAAGAPGVRVAGAARSWSRATTANSASPQAPSGSR